MEYKDLDPELRKKASECKTPGELAELAKSVGVTLTDEELDSISGGGVWKSGSSYTVTKCTGCGASIRYSNVPGYYMCPKCGVGFVKVYEDGSIGWGGYSR